VTATDTEIIRWRGLDLDRLIVEHLDDEWLIFDTCSGQTHLLPDIAAQALFALCREAHDIPGLIGLLGPRSEETASDKLPAQIGALVHQFYQLGWVEEVVV
jgi:hypothetical protein